tara:strand:- start:991 stop:1236 length:246 start_codon:yes stop_codon:yes gene_type:complete
MSKEIKDQLNALKSQNMALKMQNSQLIDFIEDVGAICLPIAGEIAAAKGFLKIFKIIKLAINLAKILIDLFDSKPSVKRWY